MLNFIAYTYVAILCRSILFYLLSVRNCLKKNQSTPRPSEHPPAMGEKMSKRLGGIKGCPRIILVGCREQVTSGSQV